MLAFYLIWKTVKSRQFRGHEVVGIVFFVAVVAELMDIRDDIREQGHPNIAESLKDTILTVFVPAAAALGQLILRQAIKFRRKIRSKQRTPWERSLTRSSSGTLPSEQPAQDQCAQDAGCHSAGGEKDQ